MIKVILFFFLGCNKSTPPTSSLTSIEDHMSIDNPKQIYLQWLSAKGDHVDFVTAGTPLGASPEGLVVLLCPSVPGR